MNSDTFLTDILKERLQSKPEPIPGDAPSVAHALVERVLSQAEKGNVDALALIWNRIEGDRSIANYSVAEFIKPLVLKTSSGDIELNS